ncbi:unnamed protein product [Sphagnum balticum]
MRLRNKVVVVVRQWPTTVWAFTSAIGMRPGTVLLKFVTSEDCQVALRGRRGLVRTKLGLDEDFMPT